MRRAHLQHHDGDDNGENAVAERLQSSLRHFKNKRTSQGGPAEARPSGRAVFKRCWLEPSLTVGLLLGPDAHELSGLPHLLQKRAEASFCTPPHDRQVNPTRMFAPQAEQKVEPALLAAPQVPQRPGTGGT